MSRFGPLFVMISWVASSPSELRRYFPSARPVARVARGGSSVARATLAPADS